PPPAAVRTLRIAPARRADHERRGPDAWRGRHGQPSARERRDFSRAAAGSAAHDRGGRRHRDAPGARLAGRHHRRLAGRHAGRRRLAALAPIEKMTGSPLTRFAPAPTGLLHLGHVVNAIFVWGLARQLGGRVLLRIEDHDRQRSRPAFEAQLLDDLDWLGFVPDIYPTADFRRGPCPSRQSDRDAIYAAVARRLAAEGRPSRR